MEDNLSAIVLAAGKGTRMKSSLPKVLHPLLGVPMLSYVLDTLRCINAGEIVVVIGHGRDLMELFLHEKGVKIAVQEEQLGTGHAVLSGLPKVTGETVLITCGDTPLFSDQSLKRFIQAHRTDSSDVSVLSSRFQDPAGYGRIIRDEQSRFVGIVEQKDATPDEQQIQEVNSGIYLVRTDLLRKFLPQLSNDNSQGEYYLTDIVAQAMKAGHRVAAYPFAPEIETLGVNSRAQLSQAEGILLDRIRRFHMDNGVTLQLANSIYIEPDVKIAKDVVIEPHCIIKGKTRIGQGVTVGAGSILQDVQVSDGATILPMTFLSK